MSKSSTNSSIGVDVVIISYAKNEKLHNETLKGLTTLIDSEDSNVINFNIIIVESNKDISYDTFNSKGHSIKTIYTNKPFGYHTYLNLGLEYAKNEWSVLCNNDLIFTKGWASNIINLITQQRRLEPEKWKYVSASPINPNEPWHKK